MDVWRIPVNLALSPYVLQSGRFRVVDGGTSSDGGGGGGDSMVFGEDRRSKELPSNMPTPTKEIDSAPIPNHGFCVSLLPPHTLLSSSYLFKRDLVSFIVFFVSYFPRKDFWKVFFWFSLESGKKDNA